MIFHFMLYLCSRLSEKDLPVSWTNLNIAMHQLVTMLFFIFTLFSVQIWWLSSRISTLTLKILIIIWCKLYSFSWDYKWDYLNEFLSEDLWTSLSHASSKPVVDVMETWTKHPVLSVTAEQVCVYKYFLLELLLGREWWNASHFRESMVPFLW